MNCSVTGACGGVHLERVPTERWLLRIDPPHATWLTGVMAGEPPPTFGSGLPDGASENRAPG